MTPSHFPCDPDPGDCTTEFPDAERKEVTEPGREAAPNHPGDLLLGLPGSLTSCPRCNGAGRIRTHGIRSITVTCTLCDGTGKPPAPLGKEEAAHTH